MQIIHPSTGKKAQDINSARSNLIEAMAAYKLANDKASFARREETEALNRLNEAQKSFDAAIADLRANAPLHSDWAQERIQGERA
jgi:hypothetical protein